MCLPFQDRKTMTMVLDQKGAPVTTGFVLTSIILDKKAVVKKCGLVTQVLLYIEGKVVRVFHSLAQHPFNY